MVGANRRTQCGPPLGPTVQLLRGAQNWTIFSTSSMNSELRYKQRNTTLINPAFLLIKLARGAGQQTEALKE
jgi:hypothetical protein